MKIACVGDIHGFWNKEVERDIAKLTPDVIVCIGDIPIIPQQAGVLKKSVKGWNKLTFLEKSRKFPNLDEKLKEKAYSAFFDNFEHILDRLNSFNKPVLILQGNILVYGNAKNYGRNTTLRKEIKKRKNIFYLHLKHKKLFGEDFIGIDHHTSYWEGKKTDDLHKELYYVPDIKDKFFKLGSFKSSILLAHQPPYKLLDKIDIEFAKKVFSGEIRTKNVGSKLIREFVEKFSPKLVICGHIHESPGIKKFKKTTVVNLGTLEKEGIFLVEINDEVIKLKGFLRK